MKKQYVIAAGGIAILTAAIFVFFMRNPAPPSQPQHDKAAASRNNAKPAAHTPKTDSVIGQLQPGQTVPVADSAHVPDHELILSDAVRSIINLSHQKSDYNDYHKPMLGLTRNLSADDVYALMTFLKQKAADHSDMRPIAFNGVKNDVLDVLLRQDKLPDGIGTLLADMYNDKTDDTMWRDYCVQFVANYYERKWIYADSPQKDTASEDLVDAEREAVESLYRNALKETDSTIAGTALLGMVSLSRNTEASPPDPESCLAPDKIKKTIEDIVLQPECGEPTRITALRLAASLGCDKVLPQARMFAQIGETVTLRMAAIATIGDLGTADDVELLESLTADSEPRIRAFAAKSLKKITKG